MRSKASPYWIYFESTRYHLTQNLKYFKGTLIDIGCGSKPFKDDISRRIQDYIGIDIPTKIKRTNESERSEEIDIYADLLKLPIKSNSVDTVFSSFVIEHVYSYETLFEEVYRVLKKDALFVLVSPLMSILHERPYDYFRFTEYALKKIGPQFKFKTIKIVPLGGEWIFMGNRLACHIFDLKYPFPPIIREYAIKQLQNIFLRIDRKVKIKDFVTNYLAIYSK